jgi:tetratricopeptide (TPR) repeat protein
MKHLYKILFVVILSVSTTDCLAQEQTDYLELGLTQNKTGNYAEALRNFSLEIEKNAANPNPNSFYGRGFAKYNLKDYRGAILDFDKAIELKPTYFDAFIARGQSYSKQENHKVAIQDYNEAIRLNPLEATAYFSRGISKAKLANHRGALSDFNKSLELNAEYAPCWAARGEAKAHLSDYKGSIEDFDKAIEISPKRSNYLSNRGLSSRIEGF